MTNRARACCFLLASLALSTAPGPRAVAAAPVKQSETADASPLQAARQAIADLDWRLAIDRYEPIQASATPGTPEWSESTLCLATAYHHVQPPDQTTIDRADALYQQVAEQSKDDRHIARALMSRGRIRELRDFGADSMDLDGARVFYVEVMERFKGQPIAAEAALRAGASLIMAFDAPEFTKVKQGLALLEKWVAEHPEDPMATVVWQYLGDSYYRTVADYRNSLRCYEQVDKLGWIDQGNQGAWYWRCAVVAERELNDRDLAVKYYTKIVKETPNSGKAYEALDALRRLKAPLPRAPLLEDAPTSAATQPTTMQSVSKQESR